jgi:hypothetical protein
MLLVVVVALAAPVAAFADGAPTPYSVANQICKQAQASMLAADFAKAYGTNASRSNAFGKCVAAHGAAATQAVSDANKTCKAERAQSDTAFAAAHAGKTFDQLYGTNTSKGNGSGSNAFGKCVSKAASASAATQAAAAISAAKSCKAAFKASAKDFADKYGTGRNAFGKCVAATSQTK